LFACIVAIAMPRRLARASRAVLAAAALGSVAAACSGAPPAPARIEAGASCDPAQLDACEKRLAATPTGERPDRALVAAYAAARASANEADPWARLWRDLDAPAPAGAAKPTVAVLAEGASPPEAAKAIPNLRLVTAPDLPAPGAIDADDLLLACGAAAGYEHLIRVRAGQVTQLFPSDPLVAFTAGLRPVVRDDQTLAHLDADVALARAIRVALDAAGAFRYLDAARAAEALDKLVPASDMAREPPVRARYALQALGLAGLVIDAEAATPKAAPAPPAPEPPPPGANDTPYASYLRVLMAKDSRKEWEIRGAKVLPGIAADRRDDLAALFSRSHDCDAVRVPPMEGVRDLAFANRIVGALARDPAAPPRAGQLSIHDWLGRYEAMIGHVERTRTVWAHAVPLVYQRGDAAGLNPAGTATYRRVTELVLQHLAAEKALQEAFPVRYRAFAQIGLIMSPGLLADEKLQKALVKLTEASVQDKLAAATEAEGVLEGVFTGAFAGLSYPPALQEAHYLALQSALSAKLHGDLLQKTGWGVAGLYAADAVYRVASDHGPNLRFSSNQIARALAAADVPYPAVAALATASARYAALAATRKLDPGVTRIEKFSPERRAARDGLRSALAGLGAPGEAPGNVLDDVADLTDGLIATLSVAVADAFAKKTPKPGACPTRVAVPLDPGTRRALARLGDVRRRILAHPRYREGSGVWVRRVRLLVTVLSDAMDLALSSDAKKRPSFTVSPADAQRAVEGAFQELDRRAVAEAVSGGYALVRDFISAKSPEEFIKRDAPNLRRALAGLIALFKSDPSGARGHELGVALLDALATMSVHKIDQDLSSALISYASSFYAMKQPDQGDLCLLASLVLSSVLHTTPSREALELAARNQSRISWAMRFSGEVHRSGPAVPDPSAYADDLRKATDDACQAADADATITVMQAIHDFHGGKRKEARAALDRVLEKADAKGLGVPRMTYKYEEKTPTKIFALTIDLSYGSGILANGNNFQLGLGFRTSGDTEGSMTAQLSPMDSAKSGEDAARYYVHAAALATVYHFLEGDHERAIAAGQRAAGALSRGVKLGSRMLRTDKPATWGADAREILIVAAQQAADAGMPMLAGDLWSVVRQGFSESLDDKEVARMFDTVPLGISGLKDLKPVYERARRSLKVVAAPLPCTDAKVELGGYEEPACEAYPTAVSLRVADVLKKLPRLRRGTEAAPHCGPLKSLDAFLGAADKGQYDPDLFTRAVEELRGDGKLYDAAVLLARQKHPNHCSPTIVTASRALGRSPLLGPGMRADLLASAVNCTATTGGPEVLADVLALDDETRAVPDPMHGLRFTLSMAELASRSDKWETLGKLAERPGFVDRWMSIHPNAAAAALLLDHAAAAINGVAVNLEKTRTSYQLLCETFPPGDRAALCAMIAGLRAPLTGPMAERQRQARESVKRMLALASQPPKKP
jgi:hypothetical protein